MKKSVMVTGGAGFIGHHLVKKLVEQNYVVYLVDDLSNPVIDVLECFGAENTRTVLGGLLNHYYHEKDKKDPSVVFVNSDFTNKDVLLAVEQGRFETVFHLAANPRVQWSVENPLEATNENLLKVLKLAKACAGVNTRMVFSSTAAVYGNSECIGLATRENAITSPASPYGLSKLCAEKYLSLFGDLFDLDWVALRYFNVYGPGQPGDSPYSTVVSAWCHKALQGEPLRSDGDGTQSRDMIHVEDVVSANLHVATAPKLNYRIFNVGTGKTVSNNYIRSLFEAKGYNKVVHAPERKGDIKESLSDISRLKDIGWAPSWEFEKGLLDVLKYWDL